MGKREGEYWLDRVLRENAKLYADLPVSIRTGHLSADEGRVSSSLRARSEGEVAP